MQIVFERQSGIWAAWSLISLFASLLRWIAVQELFISTVIMIAASSCGTGALLLALSRKAFKEVSLPTIAMLLCGAAGTFVFFFAGGELLVKILGLALILVPIAAGSLSYSMRPLQFPLQIVSKQ